MVQAPHELSLLPEAEQEPILRKYHLADARMSLASALLKRTYISKTLSVPWEAVHYGRSGHPVHGKPCYKPASGAAAPVEFNVSHQAGLVALLGAAAPGEVGVDVVCVDERDDWGAVDERGGWLGWVDTYEDFFSEQDLWEMKFTVPDGIRLLDGTVVTADELGRHDRCVTRDQTLTVTLAATGETRTFNSDLIIEAKLRRFYTFWCYKEAFIKLTGEAMMAPWLRDVEFRNVRAPMPGTVPRCSTHGVWGERVSGVEVWLRDEHVKDVRLEIQAYEEKYMVSVAVKGGKGDEEISWEGLNLQRDILEFVDHQQLGETQ